MQSCPSSVRSRRARSRTTFCFICVLAAGAGDCRDIAASAAATPLPTPQSAGAVPVLSHRCGWSGKAVPGHQPPFSSTLVLGGPYCREPGGCCSLSSAVGQSLPPDAACRAPDTRVPSPRLQRAVTLRRPWAVIAVAFDAALQSQPGLLDARGGCRGLGAAAVRGPQKGAAWR